MKMEFDFSKEQDLKLSTQAISVLMMTLQKCLLEEKDIVPMLEELKLAREGSELVVLNPPTVKFNLEDLKDA